ncbi:cytotoxic translational repressor of toxin-antitoxin stability system [Geoalkalibacter sp.]|uniref:cytotoxic translational repressor of toxin-antitoxin stability system n=1 Tax=Geoalkalibacter sp. TaxID=3041440 RepID=UPI00272DD741|nr:cytotoxic translational repressor of toxin-antitoxin stability system [Geoalkalibacter sp.]
MTWNVTLNGKANKQAEKMPMAVRFALQTLMDEIAIKGSVRGDWPNYSKLSEGRHHCHLKKGKPTYVAVWTAEKKTVRVEIIYVGTHEKAPY